MFKKAAGLIHDSVTASSKVVFASTTSGRLTYERWKSSNVVRCVLFDFFGTLVKYSPSRRTQGFEQTYALLRERQISTTYEEFLDHWVAASEELDRWSAAHKQEYGMAVIAKRFLLRMGYATGDDILVNEIWQSYLDEWNKGVTHISGVPEFIARLGAVYPLGIVTNTHHAPLIWQHLHRIGIADAFQVVVTSIEYGRPKPYPGIFQVALDALGTAPNETVYIGDSYEADYLGAIGVGMHALLIDPDLESVAAVHHRIPSVFDTEQWLSENTRS